ncbi:MAG TPA: pyridoxal-phosphate dependent enzyme [Candidatus Paceibacterota bacterium]|nr:pyridoxal-phosphate dependent enzyme [Candidatus Paceibacterota bacterium]HMO82595.1 pyridoxal-phosphate dependent enzyme [Candidatus Paceibacterota bacterium]
MTQNVFLGEDAVQAYLNPDNHPLLPLVELPPDLNPYKARGVRIFLKLMHFLPLANVKSLPAFNMLDEARRDGSLTNVHSLVESSSGNTVLSLTVLARAFGIKKTLALASNQVERGKLQLLRLLGTDIRIVEEDICPDPNNPVSGVNQAKRIGEEEGWLNAGQYHNLANPEAHQRWTGPQIWSQTNGKITVLASGLGTTGTLVGTGTYLKAQNPKVRTVGVIREPNNPVPGVRTKTLLNEIGFDWPNVADNLVPVGTREAYQTSLDLCRVGLLVGPSGGFALAGLLQDLSHQDATDLDQFRNEDGEVLAVVISPDSPLPYIDEYFRYLGEEAFPKIENEELLREPIKPKETIKLEMYDVGIGSAECLKLAYQMPIEELGRACLEQKETKVLFPVIIIDVRSPHEFDDHHLPGSDRVDYGMLVQGLESVFVPAFKRSGLKPVFVCSYGGKSTALALQARQLGVEALSLLGGTLEWSRLGFPRMKGIHCSS